MKKNLIETFSQLYFVKLGSMEQLKQQNKAFLIWTHAKLPFGISMFIQCKYIICIKIIYYMLTTFNSSLNNVPW